VDGVGEWYLAQKTLPSKWVLHKQSELKRYGASGMDLHFYVNEMNCCRYLLAHAFLTLAVLLRSGLTPNWRTTFPCYDYYIVPLAQLM